MGVAGAIIAKKMYWLLPLVASAVSAILPVLAFPFVTNRFLYLSLTSTAVVYALTLDWLGQKLGINWVRSFVWLGVSVATVVGMLGISGAAVGFAEFARVSRVPFRNVSQAHPTFPPDTRLYFIDPPLPGPSLSGMFFWRYGPSVSVGVSDMSTHADLRPHANSWVYVFDDQGDQKELMVQKDMNVRITPNLPVTFSAPLRLDGYELVSANLKASDELVLFLYWRAQNRMDADYSVLVQWINGKGQVIDGYDKEPRRGQSHTSAWNAGDSIIDAIHFPVTVAPGTYRLSISLRDPETSTRLRIMDASGQDAGDQIIIEPVSVVE